MKKLFLIPVCFLMTNSAAGQFRPGVEVGFIASTWLGNIESFDYRPGFYAGVKAAYFFNDEMLVQTGAFYSREGWKDKVKFDNEEITQVLTLNYISVPLCFGIFALGDKYRGLRFNFGFNVKFLLNYNWINQLPGGDEPAEPVVEINDVDFGGFISADYMLDENIGLSGTIYYGFIKTNTTESATYLILNNQGFRIGLYYLF